MNPQQTEPTPAQALELVWQAYQQSTGGLTGAQHQLVSRAFNILAQAINPPKPAEAPAVMSEQHTLAQ